MSNYTTELSQNVSSLNLHGIKCVTETSVTERQVGKQKPPQNVHSLKVLPQNNFGLQNV
jgi:hypothetical protein